MANYTTDRRWYYTEDKSEAVEEGDARAATLLAGEGTEVPEEVAAQYDLAKKARANPKPSAPTEGTPAPEPPPPPTEPEGEKAAPPTDDKAQRPTQNKAV